jgi:arylsulfatase A-like enzyme
VPAEGKWAKAVTRTVSFLGAAEVRDMSKVPASQLAAFPTRTAGQVPALEQRAGTRVRWTIQPGSEAYFSFIPLGTTNGCACAYRVLVREGSGPEKELARIEAKPVAPIAPATVTVGLAPYGGRKIDLLIEVDGPSGRLPTGGFPTALWGSPAVYGRQLKPKAEDLPGSQPDNRPSILFIGADTTRADALGAWGRSPSLTPALDRLAAESDVWLDAYSVFNVTNPSFASMMTGLYGKNHGVYDLKTPLPAEQTTLAEILAANGYDTWAYISAAHLGDHASGLGQGFAEVREVTEHAAAEMPIDQLMERIAVRRKGARPFFAWLHLFDPHTPHTPPEPYALGQRPKSPSGLSPVRDWTAFRPLGPRPFTQAVLGGNKDLYDGEVAYLDHQVDRLLDFFQSRGLLEDTLIVFVADHGENLGDHGIDFRHVGLFDSTTHVPLMIRWPGREAKGRRLRGLVQTIDLFPTLLKSLEIALPPQDGTDLRELTGPGRNGRPAVFAEHANRMGLMVRTSRAKVVLSQGNTQFIPDGTYFYDLLADPGEIRNLAGQGNPEEKRLAALLVRFLADRRKAPDAKTRELNAEETARLKALGYL